MSIGPTPAFVGKITITAGENDVLSFVEGFSLFTGTVPAQTYEIPDLCVVISATMSSLGANSYLADFNHDTGKITILRTSGVDDFAVNNAIASGIWTGGIIDSNGNPLVPGENGLNHLGFSFLTPIALDSFNVSTQVVANCWYPNQPPMSDDESRYQIPSTIQATSIDGNVITYDFSGYQIQTGETIDNRNQLRSLGWEFITEASRTEFLGNFWGPYAKNGSSFKFYEDKTVASFKRYKLNGDSLRSSTFVDRLVGYKYFSGSFEMIRATT